MRQAQRIKKLEFFFAQHFLTWDEALFMAAHLLRACAYHCPPATTQAIKQDFDMILTAHRKQKREQV